MLDAQARLTNLAIRGCMTVPPFTEDPEGARACFRQLRELRDRLSARSGLPLAELSMGMSHDFEVAIEEGSTCVRVGTAIFGARPYPAQRSLHDDGPRGCRTILHRGGIAVAFTVRDTAQGAQFALRVQPRASRNAIAGVMGDAIKLAITAPPVDGKANQAVIEYLRRFVSRSKVEHRNCLGRNRAQQTDCDSRHDRRAGAQGARRAEPAYRAIASVSL